MVNPIGSQDPADFKVNVGNLDKAMNDQASQSWTDRFGVDRLTWFGIETKANEAINGLAFQIPVDYAAGLNVNANGFTVTYNGVVYAPQPSAVPFTTGAWDAAQWYPIQNVLAQKNLLVFDTYAEASVAAATLPDGQIVESPNVDGNLRKYVVSGNALADLGAAETYLSGDTLTALPSWNEIPQVLGKGTTANVNAQAQALANRTEMLMHGVGGYSKIREYAGNSTRLKVQDPTGVHWWVRRGTREDNGGTVLVDAQGRSWERDMQIGDPILASWFGTPRTQTSITAAIAAAKDGDTVRLEHGEYEISTTIDVPRSIAIEGATIHGTRGIQPTTLKWTGSANGIVFKPAAWPPALGYVFSGINFDLGSGVALEIRAAFHVSVERCSFTRDVYGDAIRMLESSAGASDGSFWTILERNTFTNCTVRVNADSNATRISKCDFFSGSVPLAGPVISADGVDCLIIDECTLEGDVAAGQYMIVTYLVIGLSITNTRIENYTGGSLYLSRPLGNFNTNGTFFNTPYVVGGDRNTVAHDVGSNFTDLGNTIFSRGTDGTRFHELSNIGGVVSARNLFVFTKPSDTWYFQGVSRTLIEDGSLGLRSPVLRLYNPTANFAGGLPTASFMSIPEMSLAADAGMYATAVFIVRASLGGTADSLVYIDTGAASNELFHVPKDGKWHVMKVCKRLIPGDTKFSPTACLSYVATPAAGETLDIAGLGVFVGSGGFTLPFFDAGSASPATNGNTKFFQRGEYLRNMSPGAPNPKGWLCIASGAPGVWQVD